MRLAMNHQMQQIDRKAIDEYGIPSIVLMENAGKVVVDEIMKMRNEFQKAVIVCGPGNNGGDGFVIARHLFNLNVPVKVFVVGEVSELNHDSMLNYSILKKLEFQIDEIKDDASILAFERFLRPGNLIVDAIFGTGISRRVEGIYERTIDAINEMAHQVLSVDLPSGIDGNTGHVLGTAIDADKTIALVISKVGNILFPGSDYNGEVIIKGIGVPDVIIEKVGIKYNLITSDIITPLIPHRKRNSHKGDYGKGQIIAGSIGMAGAAILACRAALRSGMGLLKLYIPESLNTLITTSVPEVITVPMSEVRRGVIGISNFQKIIEDTCWPDVIAIGPGCGVNAEISELIKRLLNESEVPMVIDADGINALSKSLHWLENKKCPVVLTPHVGEMCRLTGLSAEEINEDPIGTAVQFSKTWKTVTVLKGARTVIATPDGEVYVNINGNSGMATAGSGDVLTGVITSMIAQGLDPVGAAVIGVYLHGRAGDLMVAERGEHGLLAGDLVFGLTKAIRELVEA
ncbi:NAD(P)H-hydrate dehydratase [Acidaminobacter sp.]|uniref:NAD(P)H-hydrate dehydratase n=1 Tax=Acidaminobacter sp. TaxID=1872102 RepID=UPI00137D5E9A|nr:NAD(P)H-hydrate dehydratase [Acidaminobacter sp.]MDK9710879.1 NAD(P)H-hydrate dehydratase [Acidaminobacter sp.]MZQ98342.1 NAD(P)H-hydrate dehydratase [Acidaminobacter sp.]